MRSFHMQSNHSKDRAVSMFRRKRMKRAQQAQLLRSIEKIQSVQLISIAHDLRTHLVPIKGALSCLQEGTLQLDNNTRNSLIENAEEEANRLNRFIGNLLDIAQIEVGAIPIILEPTDIEDVVASALELVRYSLNDRHVDVRVPPAFPPVPMDYVLIEKALVILLENAIMYSALDMPIEVSVRKVSSCLELAVADRGIGIPPSELPRVFDKFYRVSRPDSVHGEGLGLAICKGFVEAHGGSIAAESRDGGGTVMRMRLLLAE